MLSWSSSNSRLLLAAAIAFALPCSAEAAVLPKVEVPVITVPKVEVPSVVVAPINTPVLQTPEVKTPVITVPSITTTPVIVPVPSETQRPAAPQAPSSDSPSRNAPSSQAAKPAVQNTPEQDSSAPDETISPSSASSTSSLSMEGKQSSSSESVVKQLAVAQDIGEASRSVADTSEEAIAKKEASGEVTEFTTPPLMSPQQTASDDEKDNIPEIIYHLPVPLVVALFALAFLSIAVTGRGFYFARKAQQREQELREDIGSLQSALLPRIGGTIGGLPVSVAYRPAEGPAAGGDFFDAFERSDGKIVCLIGDISGHGHAALQQTAFIHYALRAWLKEGMEPRLALRKASSSLGDDLEGSFATVLIMLYDPEDATLTWSSAGHCPPLTTDKTFEPILAAGSPPVGLGMETGQRQTVMRLPGNTLICLHTDGLTEAKHNGVMIGDEGVKKMLDKLERNPETATASALLDRVRRARDSASDDLAAVLFRVPATKEETGILCEEMEINRNEDDDIIEDFASACGLSEDIVLDLIMKVREEFERADKLLLKVLPQSGSFIVVRLEDEDNQR